MRRRSSPTYSSPRSSTAAWWAAGIRGRYYVPVAGEAPFDAHVLNETLAAALWEMSEDIVAPWAGGGGKGRGSP